MAKLGLESSADPDSVIRNFTRIDTTTQQLPDVDSGLESVTGSAVVKTKLIRVDRVVSGFDVIINAATCFVVSYVGPNLTDITIEVYDNTFTLATNPADINWIAIGELNIG